jgi:hypothetical protein
MRSTWLSAFPAAILLTALASSAARADEGCIDFKWDVSQERALFSAGAPAALTAGTGAGAAPAVLAGHSYALKLAPQAEVHFASGPGRSPGGDRAAFAGIVSLRVPGTGDYRISIDAPLWLDVVSGTTLLSPVDFQGQHSYSPPHKIVVFSLQRGQRYLLQLSSGHADGVVVALTPAPKRKG